jgi:hypothetical protein
MTYELLLPLHHDMDRNVVLARGGLAVKEGRQKLGGDDHLQTRSIRPAHSIVKRLSVCQLYRLGCVGLAARPYKLLKNKALVLMVHALAQYQRNKSTTPEHEQRNDSVGDAT